MYDEPLYTLLNQKHLIATNHPMNSLYKRQGYITGLVFTLLSLTLIGCTNQATRAEPHEMLNATVGQQSSAEDGGVVSQTW